MASDDSASKGYGKLIVTGVVSLVVGVGSGLLLDYFRTKKPRLEYQIVTSSVFSGPNANIAILALEVENLGPRELDDFTAQIEWQGAELEESKIAGFLPGKYVESSTPTSFTVVAPYFNPGEPVRVDLLLSLSGPSLAQPKIDIRSKGVSAVERKPSQADRGEVLFSALLSVVAALSTAFVAFPLLRQLRARSRDSKSKFTTSHRDDPRDVMAYVLDVAGLHTEASRLRGIPRKITYWSISDNLTQEFIELRSGQECLKLAKALEQLMEYASVAETSCMLICYNLARLYVKVDDRVKAKECLTESLKPGHKVIEKRVELTPELSVLRSEIKKAG